MTGPLYILIPIGQLKRIENKSYFLGFHGVRGFLIIIYFLEWCRAGIMNIKL